jgi:hypothetical protein
VPGAGCDRLIPWQGHAGSNRPGSLNWHSDGTFWGEDLLGDVVVVQLVKTSSRAGAPGLHHAEIESIMRAAYVLEVPGVTAGCG